MVINMKRVLITGGSRGIGRACVEKFSFEGGRVAFVYKSSDREAEELSRCSGAFMIKADVSDNEQVKRAAKIALDKLGGVDILINNAGISETGLLTDLDYDGWRRVLDTNLSPAYSFCHEIIPYMVARKYGSILNIGSVWGKYGASCEAAYSATKAGLRGFTFALARELGPSGITVNCLEPGVIDTEMNSDFDEETKKELADSSALCRMGTAEEVAEAAYFLTSDKARFITAQAIGVDGGFPFG